MDAKKAATAANSEDDAKVAEKNETDKRFILFPLHLLRDLCISADALDVIFSYGVLRYAKAVPIDEIPSRVVLDAALAEYEGKQRLTVEAKEVLDEYSDYDDWDALPYDSDEWEALNEWYTISRALAKLKINAKPSYILRHGEDVEQIDGEPLVMVGVDFLFTACDFACDEKKRMALALLLGVKSIIGPNRSWAATTREMMCARMVGALKPASIPDDEDIRALHQKWSSRRRFESLKSFLLEKKYLEVFVGIPSIRRTIVSYEERDSIMPDIIKFIGGRTTKKKEQEDRAAIMQCLRSDFPF